MKEGVKCHHLLLKQIGLCSHGETYSVVVLNINKTGLTEISHFIYYSSPKGDLGEGRGSDLFSNPQFLIHFRYLINITRILFGPVF